MWFPIMKAQLMLQPAGKRRQGGGVGLPGILLILRFLHRDNLDFETVARRPALVQVGILDFLQLCTTISDMAEHDREARARQIQAELERDIRLTEFRLERLREQLKVAQQLTHVLGEVKGRPIPFESSGSSPSVRMIRAKNVGDLALQFLKDQVPGATVPELHTALTKTGLSVGSEEYLYTVVKKLLKKRLIRAETDGRKRRYFAADSRPHFTLKKTNESELGFGDSGVRKK